MCSGLRRSPKIVLVCIYTVRKMEDEKKPDVDTLNDAAKERAETLHFQRELRGLELKAYSSVLEALRASGKPSTEKDGIIKTLRDFFEVSDDRHKAELRVLAYDEKLCEISEKLNGHDFVEEWSFHAQRIYVPLSQPPFSLYRNFPKSFSRCSSIRDPLPVDKTNLYNEDSDVHSESELDLINNIIKDNPVCNGWQSEIPKPVTIAVERGTGNEDEIEEMEQQLKKRQKIKKQPNFTPARSPDITEAPKTPTKPTHVNKCESKPSNVTKGRGVKRKESEEFITSQSESVEEPHKTLENPKNRLKIRKQNKTQPKLKTPKNPLPLPVETKKSKESSEETSSADEGENGPLPLEESSRVMSPVFSEVIRSSVLSRGRGPRGRGNVDRRKNNTLTSPSKVKPGKPRPRTPNQKSGKFKNSIPTSGSRRKSKLNEKIDYDDVLMDLDGNEMEKQTVYTSKCDEVPRRLLLDSQSFDRIGDSRASFKSSEDCALYAETLPINYNHEDMEQVNDGVFKRPLPPSRGPKPWEIKDARLTHREETISDENNSNNIHFGDIESSHQLHTEVPVPQTNQSDTTILSPPSKHELPPPPKKQRIKSPLIVNPNINPPNVSKVPLTAPVFSTSLSSVNKKRQTNKPISVVDSLNLHLPTSATASSLAASSNNRRAGATVGGGCSMFSNSSALIAGARGTAPGILQQQRKAQPHILANSKVHQRSFPPAMSTGSNIVNNVNTNILPPIGGTTTFSSGTLPPSSPIVSCAPASHTVQIPSSPIPISAISTVPPSSTPLPFQSFSSSNSPSLSIAGAGVPIGHVNRAAPGANIIFVQKSNGPAIGGVSPVPNNVVSMPLKTQPRAVILRRTQLPRQGNVMILDMQKNHIVAPLPTPPLLQTARILNAPGELSLLNIQPSPGSIKSPPRPIITSHPLASTDVSPAEGLLATHQIQKPDGIVIHTTNPESFIANFSGASQINHQISDPDATTSAIIQNQILVGDKEIREHNTLSQVQEPPQDAEYAQIEAELMQMEEGSFEEVVYEEEVTTEIVPLEDVGNTQYIYTNDTCATKEGEMVIASQETLSHNASSVSGSSTDTASENEVSINHFESPDNDNCSNNRQALVKKVSLSPIEEMKIASDAVSRALSLSKLSPAKRLTFSTPITLGTTTFSFTAGKLNSVSDNLIPSSTASTINVVPVEFQTDSADSSAAVIDGVEDQSGSLKNISVGSTKSISTIEVAIHKNEILQPCEISTQDNAGTS